MADFLWAYGLCVGLYSSEFRIISQYFSSPLVLFSYASALFLYR